MEYGEEISIEIFGFDPHMEVAFWVTRQNGETVGGAHTIQVDEEGAFAGIISTSDWELTPGDYVFVAQDVQQRYRPSIAPFRVLP